MFSGSEIVCIELAEELKNAGNDVEIYAPYVSSNMQIYLDSREIKVSNPNKFNQAF